MKCPKCGVVNDTGTITERRFDGDSICGACGYKGKTAKWQQSPRMLTCTFEFRKCQTDNFSNHGDELNAKLLIAGSDDKPNLDEARIGTFAKNGEWYTPLRGGNWSDMKL